MAARFVRQDLTAQIVRALNAVISKRVSVSVGLWGSPGIGKTHAARGILAQVPCRSVSVHATASIAHIVTVLPRAKTLSTWAQASLERVSNGETLEPAVFARTVAATLAASAPFIVHFEDLHDADAAQLERIVSLATALGRTRGVGVLGTSRTPLPKPFLNHALEPLTPLEATRLLEAELNGEAPRDGATWVFERTRGNPLFALEFVRYLRRQGFLWSDGVRWHWREPPPDFVPVTVEALVLETVAGATTHSAVRAVLEARTLAPPDADVPDALWMTIADVNADTLTHARAAFEARGILRDGAFTHPLFREIVHHETTLERRRHYAKRALEALGDDPEAAIAFVEPAGLEGTQACAWFRQASVTARARQAPLRAARYLAHAAAHARGEDQGRLALEAVRSLGQTDLPEGTRLAQLAVDRLPHDSEATASLSKLLAVQGRLAEANALLERLPPEERAKPEWSAHRLVCHVAASDTAGALELLRLHPELRHRQDPETCYMTAFSFVISGQYDTGLEVATSALERLELTPFERARLRTVFAFADLYRSRFAEAEAVLSEVVAVLRTHGDAVALAGTLFNHAITLKALNRPTEARAALEDARRLYAEAGHARRLAQVQLQLAALHVSLGQFEAAESVLLESRGQLAWLGPSEQLVDCDFELSRLYAAWKPPHGRALAARHASDSLSAARSLGNPRLLIQPLYAAAEAERWRDRLECALALGDELLTLASELDHGFGRCAAHTVKGLTLEQLGQPEAAVTELRHALQHADPVSQHEIAFEIARVTNDLPAARAELEWFEAQGQVFSAQHALETFPALRTQPEPTTPPNPHAAHINVLGPITLERDSQPVPTRARKRLELLAYLLETRLGGRAEASTLELLDALYPGEPETDAKNTLKQHVYLLRSSLGADSIVSTPTGYALGNTSSDAESFLDSGDTTLWRGAYLGGHIERWRPGVCEALVLGLRSSIEACLTTDAREAARLGAILCDMEPYDPDALRLHLQALKTSGDARAANRVFLEGRARLREVGELISEGLDEFVMVGAGVA
jgi:tetratricopeptide (TPR) repeat protein